MLKKKLILILPFALGSLTWVLTMFKSGLRYSFGIGFWGANGHDSLWHIALAERISKLSFESPVFAGETIKNYHVGFGILISLVNKLTTIPFSVLYFQVFPILFSVLIGYLVYKFVVKWRNSRTEAWWAVVFTYFGTGLGMIITLVRDGKLTGESMFWSQQAISTLINPPYALSLIFILLGLVSLITYLKKPKVGNLILTAFLFGILIQVKSYAGIVVLFGLGIASIYQIIFKRNFGLMKVTVLSAIISLAIFYPFLKDAAGIITWQPFWFLETMMAYGDRLGWARFYSAMSTYKMGDIWVKAILAYGVAFLIFIVGNMGIRIISIYSFWQIAKKKIKLDELGVFSLGVIGLSLLIPTFFVQKGTPWNTIQFFYYFLFFCGIWAGISTATVVKKSSDITKVTLVGLIFTFVILGVVSSLGHYLPKTPPAKIGTEEIEALSFLAKQKDGVVLTYPFDRYKAKEAEAFAPRPLYLYESTAYVSAYGKKTVFLEDEVNLDITDYFWKERKENVLNFFDLIDEKEAYKFLRQNNIFYVYLLEDQRPKVGDFQLGLTKIFENEKVVIFKLNEI